MVNLRPYRAIRYDPSKVGDLSLVTAQPYDKIDAALQEVYFQRHPKHFVRIIRGREGGSQSWHAGAAKTLNEWLAEGTMVRESRPAFWSFTQTYATPGGRLTRTGISAMVEVEPFEGGKIRPHERTHHGPKEDRYRLLEQTRTHTEHIFLLYDDPGREMERVLASAPPEEPELRAVDDLGEEHSARPIRTPEAIRAIQDFFRSREAVIADGHHRYETALSFSRAHPESRWVLASLVNLHDPGLTLFATHRGVRDIPPVSAADILSRISPLFSSVRFGDRGALSNWLRSPSEQPRIGMLVAGDPAAYGLELSDAEGAVARRPAGASREWALLSVNLLHASILEPALGVTPEDTAAERKVSYYRHEADAVRALQEGRLAAVFLLRPVTVQEILTIVRNGERFPEKSTDFYPKLLSGLLLSPIDP